MDILQQELNKNKKPSKNSNSKKIVLSLIIVCVVLLILAIVGIIYLKSEPKQKKLSISIDDKSVSITEGLLLEHDNNTYIAIKLIAQNIPKYNYTRGGYEEFTEDDKKGYIENDNQIIGFEANSNEIYKTSKQSKTDYQYIKLKNKIVLNDNLLYIALEDLNKGLNVYYTYSEKENKITINTLENVVKQRTKDFTNASMSIPTNSYNNLVAISYGMFVVKGNNDKMGVVDANLQTIIGNRYSTMEFNEFNQTFIVSDGNKYGVVSDRGEQIIDIRYQDLEIINYSPLLYKFKKDDKYGVIDEKGNVVVKNDYDEIGKTGGNKDKFILIIDNINGKQKGIVVAKNRKYGIVDMENGKEIVGCEIDDIYLKDDKAQIEYYVKAQNTEVKLDEYINYVNTIVVNVPNE